MTNSISEIGDAACIFVIGSNATATHPIIGRQISRAIRRGAKLIAADPRRTEMRRMADIWMGHQPGTDVALLNAMARVIIAEKLYDASLIEERCDGFEAFKESVMGPPLSMAETVTASPWRRLPELPEHLPPTHRQPSSMPWGSPSTPMARTM